MDYATLLRWVHVPIAALFLLNLVCLALTVHSWLLSDWFIARSVETKPGSDGLNEKWGTIMVDYLSRSTDTTFISEFIALAAAIVCFLSWYKLRRRDMDMKYNQVRRHFWLGFALLMLAATSGAAFAALAFHYIDKGPDEYGCRSTTGSRKDLIMSCTREMGVCRALTDLKRISTREWKQKWNNPWAVQLACNEMQAVKWMQCIIALICLAAIGVFGTQAWVRRKARHEDMEVPIENELTARRF